MNIKRAVKMLVTFRAVEVACLKSQAGHLHHEMERNNVCCAAAWGMMMLLLSCTIGCRQTYEDPQAFVERYVEPYLWEHVISKAWLEPLELKGLVFEDVRLEADYGTAVCATLRLVRKSDKTTYMYAVNADYMPGKILTKEELESALTATVAIQRLKMDNGVFAPITKMTRHDIQGYGLLGELCVADLKKIKKQSMEIIGRARKQIDSCSNPQDLENLFERLLRLATNRHLDYLGNKEVFQLYYDNLERCFAAAGSMKNKGRIRLTVSKEALLTVSELCRNYGILSPRGRMMAALRKADFNTAQSAARIVLASEEKDPDAHFAVGMWHYQNRRWKEAESHLNRCKDIRPKEVAVWNNLAMIYLSTGRLDIARRYARHALSLLPDSEEVKDTLMQVENAIRRKARRD